MKTNVKNSEASQPNVQALTQKQLAGLLHVGVQTVRGWARMGCPCYAINDRPTTADHARLRFVLDDVVRWRKSMTLFLR